VHLDHAPVGQGAEQLAEGAEAVIGFAERGLLAEDRTFQHRGQHRAVGAPRETGERAGDQRVEVSLLGRGHDLVLGFGLGGGPSARRRPTAPSLRRALRGLPRLDPFQALVEEELVARRGKQRGGRRFDTDADDALVELAELVHQRREVAVAGAEHERRDVVALEAELDRVDRHLDVGRVLADHAHALGDLDELDLVAGEHAPVLLEVRPVGVGAPDDDPPSLGKRVGDRPEVERTAESITGADREVLVVEEERNSFVVAGHCAIVTC
jgi:hypothetical protein